ncbi:hypothetical protein LDENG_00285890 [Lucifuga dentata]|nr:hypothetical protein LDENG_00285890 [Lucifuga dentata]
MFQQKNYENFGDIQDVHIIADDMIIAASSNEEHKILHKVMERAKAANVKFNRDKIQFKVNTVKYMGHIITPDGQKPDDAKVKAIIDMPPPEEKQGLQQQLGMIKYLAQYIPQEASLTAPLRQLLRKGTMWQWCPHHSAALKSLKATLTRAPVLRALTETEQRYAQIEKELLTVVFSAKRFHQYTYGRTVTVQTDHKPLEAIVQKQLSKAPSRLQRMLLQLQRYDLNITYTPGKHMYIADTLSRATTNGEAGDVNETTCDEKVVFAMEATDALSTETRSKLKEATAADSMLQAVCERHKKEWPEKRDSVDRSLHNYWPMQHNISIQNGIVMVRDKIIIPQSFKKKSS